MRNDDTLYGRYWGASGDYHSLHFETCLYRGIEYCIREGLARFEPGTQGEHKLLRGFVPAPVWSLSRDRRPGFAVAIGDWLKRERRHAGVPTCAPRRITCPFGAPISRLGFPPMSGIAWLQKTDRPEALPPRLVRCASPMACLRSAGP